MMAAISGQGRSIIPHHSPYQAGASISHRARHRFRLLRGDIEQRGISFDLLRNDRMHSEAASFEKTMRGIPARHRRHTRHRRHDGLQAFRLTTLSTSR